MTGGTLRWMLLVTAVVGLGSASEAWAGPDCEAPYASDQVLLQLTTIEEFLRNGDDVPAGKAAEELQVGLGCLNEILPSMIVGRVYRAVGAGLVATGNGERGRQWFATSLELDPTFTYGLEDLRLDHPARLAFDEVKRSDPPDPVPLEGQSFADGKHYVDSQAVQAPQARPGRPHVYQRKTEAIESWLIEGNAFPAEVLAAAAVADADAGGKAKKEKKEKAPKEKTAKAPKEKPEKEKTEKAEPEKVAKAPKEKKGSTQLSDSGAMVIKRQWPWEKTAMLAGGGLLLAGGAGLWLGSASAADDFRSAESQDDVKAARDRANQLFIASAVALGAGTGVLTWGVVLHGGTPMPVINVRF